MKLEKTTLANALALATAITWTLCSLFVLLLPDFSMTVTGWWFHGLDLSPLGSFRLDLSNFLLGGVTLVISAWVIGYLFGWSWEKVSKGI